MYDAHDNPFLPEQDNPLDNPFLLPEDNPFEIGDGGLRGDREDDSLARCSHIEHQMTVIEHQVTVTRFRPGDEQRYVYCERCGRGAMETEELQQVFVNVSRETPYELIGSFTVCKHCWDTHRVLMLEALRAGGRTSAPIDSCSA